MLRPRQGVIVSQGWRVEHGRMIPVTPPCGPFAALEPFASAIGPGERGDATIAFALDLLPVHGPCLRPAVEGLVATLATRFAPAAKLGCFGTQMRFGSAGQIGPPQCSAPAM